MKRFVIFALTAIMGASCYSQKLILHYDFKKSENNIVTDRTKSHNIGTLIGSAQIKSEQGETYADLGYDKGYIDMGKGIGEQLQSIDDFTVAVKYNVEEKASLNGNG